MDFETFLREHRGAIERFVRFKISDPFDADDILQETYLAAGNESNCEYARVAWKGLSAGRKPYVK